MTTITAPRTGAGERAKLLLVDDEVALLDGLRRQLRGKFDVTTAAGADEALALMAVQGPFAAVLSDMHMPGTDGAAFLAEVRQRMPDTVRLLLTGQADVATAVAAVNDGQIFRFLTKPCPPETLLTALGHAVEHYRLVRVEKDLLEQTLRGAVQSLIDVLALAHPAAFSRAVRIAQIVTELSESMTGRRDWEVEVTGLLAQIGAVTLPVQVLEKMDNGLPLSREERAMLAKVPGTSQDLLAHIPRLENVVAAIGYQRLRYDGTGRPPEAPRGDDIPLVARILRVALDFDMLRSQRLPPMAAIERLRSVEGDYDPAVLDAWQALHAVEGVAEELPIQVTVSELRTGMTLMEDVHNTGGMLLLGRGSVVTEAVIRRLENHVRQSGIRGSILVSPQRRERRGIAEGD
jgi:response regulator RpfG family c-di-GMP phosphodiesterase